MTNALWTVNLCCVMLFEIVNMSLQEGKLTTSLKTVISLEGFFFLIAQKTTVLVLSHSILCYNKQCQHHWIELIYTGREVALHSLERKVTEVVGGATEGMYIWTAVDRHRLFCQCSYLARLKPFAVQKLYDHSAPTNTPHLSAAFLVQAQRHISMASRPGLARVQLPQKSGCFSEAIVWMCPGIFCQSNFATLRAA